MSDINRIHDYQKRVTHRVRVTLPIVVEVEVATESNPHVMAKAMDAIADSLRITEPRYRSSWGSSWVDDVTLGDPKFVSLPLKPVPEPDEDYGKEQE